MHRLLTCLCVGVVLSGCATVDPANDTRTEVDKAIGRCIASVAVGTILGAVIGNNLGDGDAGRGAAIGAGAGGALCAVMMAVANEEDKRRIAALQMRTYEQGAPQVESYVGSDNRARTILTSVETAPPGDSRGGDFSLPTRVHPDHGRWAQRGRTWRNPLSRVRQHLESPASPRDGDDDLSGAFRPPAPPASS
mgnify:CR=1 FL=1